MLSASHFTVAWRVLRLPGVKTPSDYGVCGNMCDWTRTADKGRLLISRAMYANSQHHRKIFVKKSVQVHSVGALPPMKMVSLPLNKVDPNLVVKFEMPTLLTKNLCL